LAVLAIVLSLSLLASSTSYSVSKEPDVIKLPGIRGFYQPAVFYSKGDRVTVSVEGEGVPGHSYMVKMFFYDAEGLILELDLGTNETAVVDLGEGIIFVVAVVVEARGVTNIWVRLG